MTTANGTHKAGWKSEKIDFSSFASHFKAVVGFSRIFSTFLLLV